MGAVFMRKVLSFIMCFILVFSLTACNGSNNSTPTASPETEAINSVNYDKHGSYEALDDEYLIKLSNFSNKVYEMASKNKKDNYAISPLSIYMALAVLHYIGDENVKQDIETLFEMTNEDIAKTGKLFMNLVREIEFDGEVVSKLDMTNSIWFDSLVNGNKNVLDQLAKKLFCYAFKTPFSQNIEQANEDIRQFIKEQTNGLIDKDFDIPADTLFALFYTLYFKDMWNDNGLKLQTKQDKFYLDNGEKEIDFLIGNYYRGDVAETDSSYYFYTMTQAGYKIKFIVPKDGYSLAEAMTAGNLNIINDKISYVNENEEGEYYTRCIFPKFKVDSDTDLKDIFEKNGYLQNAFSGYTSELIDANLVVSEIIHKTVIDVDDEGIEGAAVTIILSKETSVGPGKPKYYKDFLINKNFGFIVTDNSNTVLFEGQIKNPENV